MNNFSIQRRGFTLTEIVIVIAIIAVIIVAFGSFGGDMFRYNRVVGNSITAQQDARQTLKQFSAELRSAEPSENGSFVIAETGENSFTFYSDTDKDGAAEQIKYYLSGTDIMYSVVEPSGSPAVYTATPKIKTMVKSVANGATPIFTYYDSSYTGSSAPLSQPVDANNVRLVKINLLIDHDPSQPPDAIAVTTQVVVRNLKDNL